MKRFVLPLVLILILSFTLVSNCAWLSGWDQRIELAIGDYAGDIGASVTWFPVTVFLTATQAEEVFVELTTDAEYLKVAFTKADGTTELYAEMEIFDVSETNGIFHISRDGWTINANTTIYIYYDKDHADNTTYIGAINTAAGGNVWDGNFKAVYHMIDATTSTVVDSTSNNNDGTKLAANEPIEADGKVGKGQNFDATDDLINCGSSATLNSQAGTIEAVFDYDTENDQNHDIIAKFTWTASNDNSGYILRVGSNNQLRFTTMDNGYTWINYDTSIDTKYHAAGVWDDTNTWLYTDGVERATNANSILDSAENFYIGNSQEASREFDGIISEVRMSGTNRAVAWVKATYNTLFDTLLTYGSEESAGFTWNTKTITKWNDKTISTWNGM